MKRISALLLLACSILQAQDRVQNLAGKWKFHPGDDVRWAAPDFDDSQWTEIEVPKAWKDAGYPTLSGYGWYRTPVQLTGEDNAIFIGGVSDAYEVYANGVRLGSAGVLGQPRGQDQYEKVWPIPAATTSSDGRLQISVRVWMTPPVGGIIEEVRVGSRISLQQHAERQMIIRHNRTLVAFLPTLLNATVGLLSGVFVLLLYAMDRSHREYFWFGCLQLCLPIILVFFLPVVLTVGQVPEWGNAMISATFTVFTIQFVLTFLGLRLGWWTRGLQTIPLIIAVIAFWGNDVKSASQLISAMAGFTCIWLVASRLSRFSQEEVAFSAALVIGFLGMAIDSFLLGLSSLGFISITAYRAYSQAISVDIHGMNVYLPNVATTLTPCLMMLVLLRRFQRTHREELRMRGELESARAMQSLMASAIDAPGFVTEIEYHPASEVGGDFYQILPASDGSILIVVGDVSGKGMKAAMLASAVIGALGDLVSKSPGDVLAHLNRAIAGKTHGGFVTCCCTSMNANGQVSIANAGHLAPYLKGGEVEVSSGLPLGLTPDATYDETRLTLEPGAALTFLSDGVIEAANKQGELFGFDRTREISGKPANKIAQAANDWGQNDDITVVTVRRDVLPAV